MCSVQWSQCVKCVIKPLRIFSKQYFSKNVLLPWKLMFYKILSFNRRNPRKSKGYQWKSNSLINPIISHCSFAWLLFTGSSSAGGGGTFDPQPPPPPPPPKKKRKKKKKEDINNNIILSFFFFSFFSFFLSVHKWRLFFACLLVTISPMEVLPRLAPPPPSPQFKILTLLMFTGLAVRVVFLYIILTYSL